MSDQPLEPTHTDNDDKSALASAAIPANPAEPRKVNSVRAESAAIQQNEREENEPESWFHVVGVGASAGGLEALERMFDRIPADTGMAFVIVQHLSPDFKSLMSELLGRHTPLAIHRVTDGMRVEANNVYLIPPKKEMILCEGRLLLTDRDSSHGLSLPIDHFFRSLAQDAGRRAIAIVLSGTGSDGSRGIRDVHEAGGLVIAQSESSAKFDGMPRSAQETGAVDIRVDPEDIADVLLRYVRFPVRSQWAETNRVPPGDESALDRILNLLVRKHHIDFRLYKPTTVTRRIERRMQLKQVADFDGYEGLLLEDPGELDRLHQDMLIGVTRFFRDREAFDILEKNVLPAMVSGMQPTDELRAWVPACATGEEVYSLAILIDETLKKWSVTPRVKIFATDVCRESLSLAQTGLYSEADMAEISQARRERYFRRSSGVFQISPSLREWIVFAPHNLIHDPPFTNLDLVSCRNLLIYLRPEVQAKSLSLLQFGLKPGGALFLGASETLGEVSPNFDIINDRWKLFRKRSDARLPLEAWNTPVQSSSKDEGTSPTVTHSGRASRAAAIQPVYDDLLNQFMPPSVVVNEECHVLQMFGGVGRFMELNDGFLSGSLPDLLSESLRIAVAGGFDRLQQGEDQVTFDSIPCDRVDTLVQVRMKRLKPSPLGQTFLVSFNPQEANTLSPLAGDAESHVGLEQMFRDRVRGLENELGSAREDLQMTIEELETSNEELQATNEELVASNEELQSTNEELHSVNEELYTVNAEYQNKISELTQLTNDMDNLLTSTEVYTLFLSDNLRIRKFTPNIGRVFHLLPNDIGRPIDNFVNNIDYEELVPKLAEVASTRARFETEVRDRAGRVFLLRMLPYQGSGPRSGIVLTLVDITIRRRAEQQFRVAFEGSPAGLLIMDSNAIIVQCNHQTEEMFGFERGNLHGRKLTELIPERFRTEHTIQTVLQFFDKPHDRRLSSDLDLWGLRRDGSEFPVDISINPLETDEGSFVLGVILDMTERRTLENSLRHQIEQRDRFLAVLSHELRNPLAALLSATCVWNDARADAETRDAAAQVAERQASHMGKLLDDLIDVARVRQEKISLRKTVYDLRLLIEPSAETVQPELTNRKQTLEYTPPTQPVWVHADIERLHQILVNLLTNASRYSPPGSTIQVLVEATTEHALLEVRDNGDGIPAEMLESIFELFVQRESQLDRTEGGLGLGLTLVKHLVEMHGGEISVHSPGVGQGSTFIVRLPKSDPPQTLTAAPPPDETNHTPAACRIVLVEDNDDSRLMLQALLRLRGHTVWTAADGQRGLECIIEHRPDVAILDVGLPELNGYELARQIREHDTLRSTRLIALTGYGQPDDRSRASAAGFDAHLTKPVELPLLQQALASLAPANVRSE